MMLTAGGLSLILLGGVVATPGRTPDQTSTTNVGLIADNTSASVAPNADFQRGRAKVLGMLDKSVSKLRSKDTPFTAAAADRLDAISERLAMASPSNPDQLESIVADLKREARYKLAARPGDPAPSGKIQHASRPRPVPPPTEVTDLLADIIAALRDLIRALVPPLPYIYVPGSRPQRPSRVLGNVQQQLPLVDQELLGIPALPGVDDLVPSRLVRTDRGEKGAGGPTSPTCPAAKADTNGDSPSPSLLDPSSCARPVWNVKTSTDRHTPHGSRRRRG